MNGRITGITGPTVRTDLPGLKLYDRVHVGHRCLTGEVVRLEREEVIIQVYEDCRGLAVGEPVKGQGEPLSVQLGPGLLSSMYDGLQRPLVNMVAEMGPFIRSASGISALNTDQSWEFHAQREIGVQVGPGDLLGYFREKKFKHTISVPPGVSGIISWIGEGMHTLSEPICRLADDSTIFPYHTWPVRTPRPYREKLAPEVPIITGQRIIDFLFPVARGGTCIIPGGFGTGKTILEQTIAKLTDVDIVVYAGCGERGNEMSELIEEFMELKDPITGADLMDRTILVVNTSNMPVAAREASIYTAVTISEYYRDMGYDVLLLADSLSRWAEALREISSSLEEMPGEEGYPTYLASRLAAYIERAGRVKTANGKTGSLSMILSVSPPGGDFTEPVTQALLRTTGVFLMLDTELAHARHFPAIHWRQSFSLYDKWISTYFEEHVNKEWGAMQHKCREILRQEEAKKEVMEIVGMEGLQDKDRLLMMAAEEIRSMFLAQNAFTADAFSSPLQTFQQIHDILLWHEQALEKLDEGRGFHQVIQDRPLPKFHLGSAEKPEPETPVGLSE